VTEIGVRKKKRKDDCYQKKTKAYFHILDLEFRTFLPFLEKLGRKMFPRVYHAKFLLNSY
jgi:hypothetical protein